MASNLCIGTLVRLKDSSAITDAWRGQLALIIEDDALHSGFIYRIRRLHDGREATCSINGFDIAGDEG